MLDHRKVRRERREGEGDDTDLRFMSLRVGPTSIRSSPSRRFPLQEMAGLQHDTPEVSQGLAHLFDADRQLPSRHRQARRRPGRARQGTG
jgi:hypothetical protein